MAEEANILVVEDDAALAASIREFISPFATVEIAETGPMGEYLAEPGTFDAIILDVMLPEKDGFAVLKSLREAGITTPVLFLTAKSAVSDKVRGFETGGDDYLTKPFHREELIVRVKALLRRAGHFFTEGGLQAGDLIVDPATHSARVGETELTLNGKEFDLLVYLLQNQNTIITKDQIFDRLWGFDSDTAVTVVEVYMSNLRKRLRPNGADTMIQTIRNVGYILKSEERA